MRDPLHSQTNINFNKLESLIIQKIKSKGPIPFDEFMEMALYYPELGYYMRENLIIGKEGDFFTSSHLGKVFGIILTKAIEKIWKKMEYPHSFSIIEIGPGMGYLAQDILEEITEKDIFSEINLKYILVEVNPKLMKIQKERLVNFLDKVLWQSSIEELGKLNGIIICNEIFDALPVRVFQIKKGKPLEIYVDFDEEKNITEIMLPARNDTIAYLEEFAPWVFQFEGYRSEINLKMREFIEKLAFMLNKGYVIILDYGFDSEEYFSPQRSRGTLLCYHRHIINENPYINIGQQDITSHVNFSALKKWAKKAGFNVDEYTSQANFLISLCDENLLKRFQQEDLINKFKRLVLPQGMGETHRVMVLSKNLN